MPHVRSRGRLMSTRAICDARQGLTTSNKHTLDQCTCGTRSDGAREARSSWRAPQVRPARFPAHSQTRQSHCGAACTHKTRGHRTIRSHGNVRQRQSIEGDAMDRSTGLSTLSELKRVKSAIWKGLCPTLEYELRGSNVSESWAWLRRRYRGKNLHLVSASVGQH